MIVVCKDKEPGELEHLYCSVCAGGDFERTENGSFKCKGCEGDLVYSIPYGFELFEIVSKSNAKRWGDYVGYAIYKREQKISNGKVHLYCDDCGTQVNVTQTKLGEHRVKDLCKRCIKKYNK